MKWEYTICSIGEDVPNEIWLNETMGSKGWELIIIKNKKAVFKRPIPEPVEQTVIQWPSGYNQSYFKALGYGDETKEP